MRRNIKGLYTELAFEDGAALVDESIVREQLRQKRLKRQRARKKMCIRDSCNTFISKCQEKISTHF